MRDGHAVFGLQIGSIAQEKEGPVGEIISRWATLVGPWGTHTGAAVKKGSPLPGLVSTLSRCARLNWATFAGSIWPGALGARCNCLGVGAIVTTTPLPSQSTVSCFAAHTLQRRLSRDRIATGLCGASRVLTDGWRRCATCTAVWRRSRSWGHVVGAIMDGLGGGTVQAVALKHFGARPPAASPDHEAAVGERSVLLSARWALRARLRHDPEAKADEVDDLEFHLCLASRGLRRILRLHIAEYRHRLLEDALASPAWRSIARSAQAAGQCRRGWEAIAPPVGRDARADGGAGRARRARRLRTGARAMPIPSGTMTYHDLAAEGIRDIRWQQRSAARKRRGAPPWSLSTELWHMIMRPNGRCRAVQLGPILAASPNMTPLARKTRARVSLCAPNHTAMASLRRAVSFLRTQRTLKIRSQFPHRM